MCVDNIKFYKNAIKASDCISNGWFLVGQNYVLFIGIVILGNFLGGCIPIIPFLRGPFDVGIYYAMLIELKGERAELRMLFNGFRNATSAIVVGLIAQIPSIISNLFNLVVSLAKSFEVFKPDELEPNQFKAILIVVIIVGLFFIFLGFFISTSLFFAPMLIAEHNLDAIQAMKLSFKASWSNIIGLIALGLIEFLIVLLGLLFCCFSVYLIAPIIIAANTIAYRQVFPPLELSVQEE